MTKKDKGDLKHIVIFTNHILQQKPAAISYFSATEVDDEHYKRQAGELMDTCGWRE